MNINIDMHVDTDIDKNVYTCVDIRVDPSILLSNCLHLYQSVSLSVYASILTCQKISVLAGAQA